MRLGVQASGDAFDCRERSRHQKEIDMRRMFGFMIGVLVGGLVGATVALLLAPQSGEKLRNELRLRGEGFVAEVRRAAEQRRIDLTDRLETLKADRSPRSAA